jgi:hypothetical protein
MPKRRISAIMILAAVLFLFGCDSQKACREAQLEAGKAWEEFYNVAYSRGLFGGGEGGFTTDDLKSEAVKKAYYVGRELREGKDGSIEAAEKLEKALGQYPDPSVAQLIGKAAEATKEAKKECKPK